MPRRSLAALPLWLAAGWLVVWAVHALGAPLPAGPVRPLHLAALAIGVLACLARAVRRPESRAAWALLGLGAAAWTLGEAWFTTVLWDDPSPPVPSPADAGFLLFPPLAFAGIALLIRARTHAVPPTVWFDATSAGCAAGAVAAATVLQAVLVGAQDVEGLALATNLAYPLADVVLLGLLAAGVAALHWHLDRPLLVLIAGVGCFLAADVVYLVSNAHGTWTSGGPADCGWVAGILLFGVAARLAPPPARVAAATAGSGRAVALPIAFACMSLGVLLTAAFVRLNLVAIGLAAVGLLAVFVRLLFTLAENGAMLTASRDEARTDALTGLGNRRALVDDLDEAFRTGDHTVLAIFDLDGFKHYNDTFGHPAGDALLQRLGAALAERVRGAGRAYRLGGDEFCVLLAAAEPHLVLGCSAALAERGDGFTVTASFGSVALGAEAATPVAALGLADVRLYAHKRGGRASARHQAKEVLLRTLAERDGQLGSHVHDVAALAAAVARELGAPSEDVELTQVAAELHDIGKAAIPDAILHKPGPLTDVEWQFMRQHTVIGARILAAAPALAPAASLVRASHERWDGTGYPDRLAGRSIPVGARIVAVCDTFDAMTTTRPYRRATTPQAALEELVACAGTQFDPDVVAAFARVLAAREPLRL